MSNDDLLRDLRALVNRYEAKPDRQRPTDRTVPQATEEQMRNIITLEQRLGWRPTHTERLIKSLFPRASRNNLTYAQAAILLRKMSERYDTPVDRPDDRPDDRPTDPGNTRLKVWDDPINSQEYTFCGPERLPNTLAEPLSTTPFGTSAWRMRAIVDPSKLDEDGTIAVADLQEPLPVPTKIITIEIFLEDGVIQESMSWGVHELPGFEVIVDQFGEGCEVSIRSLRDQYVKRIEIQGEIALVDPQRPYFPFLEGQTTSRMAWLGHPNDGMRFHQGLHIATLLGEESYSKSGWGPTNHPQPDLEEDFRAELDLKGRADAIKLQDGSHPAYAFSGDSLGPWMPLDARSGGGTGGGGIHPYSAIGVSAGELLNSWWRMRGVMERSLENRYDWGAAGPDIPHPTGNRAGYEAELVRYQKFDQAHASRALIDAMAAFWGRGSLVAGHWLRRQADVQGKHNDFPAEFHGKGHKYAHRVLGWKAFNWALAASTCTTAEDRKRYQDHCDEIAADILAIAMPSGITMRSGSQQNPGPFAAWMNPDLIKLGVAPDGTTLLRTFMQAIVAYGAYALYSQMGDDDVAKEIQHFITRGLASVLGHDSSPAPKNHFVVGGVGLDSEVVDPYPVEKDNKRCGWEMMFWCAAAFGVTQDPAHLLQAAKISGWDSLEEMLEKEYTRTGSQTAWWARTPEIVAEAQQLLS